MLKSAKFSFPRYAEVKKNLTHIETGQRLEADFFDFGTELTFVPYFGSGPY